MRDERQRQKRRGAPRPQKCLCRMERKCLCWLSCITPDATIRTEVQVIVEHILSDRPGEWRVSIVGSRAKEDWR